MTDSRKTILPSKGNVTMVGEEKNPLPFGIYSDSEDFKQGAADQVAFVYNKLGGEMVDIELSEHQVYGSYEESVLEYSEIINSHQAMNVLSNILGNSTGDFDSKGELLESGDVQPGENINLKFPRFDFSYARRVADGISSEVGVGGSVDVYRTYVDLTPGIQDYDLQTIIQQQSESGELELPFSGKVNNKMVQIKKVYYKTRRAMWQFFGYWGGLNVVGNLSNYGQYADASTFEVIPAWQNKLQAMQYMDSIKTRLSHFSYELRNNKLRLFPIPQRTDSYRMWVEFTIPQNTWEQSDTHDVGMDGVNNYNTVPFPNLLYKKINSMGKHWIRKYSLALCKEMLGQVRGKFASIPIPGNDVQLNASDLLSQAAEEKEQLRTTLQEKLDKLTYNELMKGDSELVAGANEIQTKIPLPVFTG